MMKKIDRYVVAHRVGGATEINLYSGKQGVAVRPKTEEEAEFLVDLLRNEKPLWYDKSKKLFQTSYEPAGEAE